MARWPSGHSHNPLRFPKIKKTMNRNTLALLLAVATGSAHAAADAFTDSIPAKAEGIPLAYIGKDTRAATALTLTAKPDGGDAIGYLPQDSSVHVLLADDHGNHLVRTDYGITGWAQKGEKLEAGSEAFPALETLTETFNGDTLATIHYNPQLGKKQDSYYHYDANNKAVAGKAPAVARAQIRLLQPHQRKSDAEQTVRRENPQLARIGKLHHRITLHLRRGRADVAPVARQRRLHPLQITLRRRAFADGIAQLLRRRDIRRPALLRRLIAAIKQHIDHRHTRRIDLAQMRVEKIVHHP